MTGSAARSWQHGARFRPLPAGQSLTRPEHTAMARQQQFTAGFGLDQDRHYGLYESRVFPCDLLYPIKRGRQDLFMHGMAMLNPIWT